MVALLVLAEHDEGVKEPLDLRSCKAVQVAEGRVGAGREEKFFFQEPT